MDKIESEALKPLGRALLPLALTKSANYDHLYATVCVSPTIEKNVAKVEGKVVDSEGKVRKTRPATRKAVDGNFVLWTCGWELNDLPPGIYTVDVTALDKDGKAVTSRTEKLLHGNPVEKK